MIDHIRCDKVTIGEPPDIFERTAAPPTATTAEQETEPALAATSTTDCRDWAIARKPWIARASELAEWALSRAVNRADVWGGYLPMKYRVPGKQHVVTKPRLEKRNQEFLVLETIKRHFKGAKPEHTIGTHSTSALCTCLWGGWDLDRHGDGPEQPTPAALFAFAHFRYGELVSLGFRPLLTDSNGKGGLHLRIYFTEPVDSGPLFRFLQRSVDDHAQHGLKDRPETFPKQPELSENCTYGNWLRLPGRHHTRDHFSRVWNGLTWLDGNDAIDFILSITGDSPDLLPFIEPPAKPTHEGGHVKQWPHDELGRVSERARLYVGRIPGAVERQFGDRRTYHVACVLVKGFQLTPNQALPIMAEWNVGCEPPWEERDLIRKLECAAREDGPDGYILNAERQGAERDQAPEARSHGVTEPDTDGQERHDPSIINLTDLGNARRMVRDHKADIKYCYKWKSWLVWDGARWVRDESGEIFRRAKATIAGMFREAAGTGDDAARAALARHALFSESRGRIAAMVELAESEPGVQIAPDQMDVDPWLLNCRNGTLDLRSGELRPHRREDLLTKLCPTPYDPSAKCPKWDAMLHKIMAEKMNMVAFLRRFAGYSLTGVVRDHVLLIAWGDGQNGKSTFVNAILAMLGDDYAIMLDKDLLVDRKNDKNSTERMDLFGKRFAAAIETDEGNRLSEAFIKSATGGDPIRGRNPYERTWQFNPTHKILLATNHKPEIRGTDTGMWRRLKLTPFTVEIPEAQQDKTLMEKLKAEELPGILAWAVRGCLEWQRDGLGIPEDVVNATAVYRAEMDNVARFVAECCVTMPTCKVRLKLLLEKYTEWCADRGERAISGKKFGIWMGKRFEKEVSDGTWYVGLGLAE